MIYIYIYIYIYIILWALFKWCVRILHIMHFWVQALSVFLKCGIYIYVRVRMHSVCVHRYKNWGVYMSLCRCVERTTMYKSCKKDHAHIIHEHVQKSMRISNTNTHTYTATYLRRLWRLPHKYAYICTRKCTYAKALWQTHACTFCDGCRKSMHIYICIYVYIYIYIYIYAVCRRHKDS